jgi:hypothetical protein
MSHESRAKLIKRIFFLVLVGAIAAGVWFYPKPKAPVIEKAPQDGVALILYYVPGDPASEQLSTILDKVQKKYGKQMVVNKVDFKKNPETAKKEGVTETPHVAFIFGKEKVFEFEGLLTQEQVESKVEEILHGLKRVEKDWRPVVPGMTGKGLQPQPR